MKRLLSAIIAFMIPNCALSAPVVIYDSGKSQPIDNYVSVFEGPKRFSPPTDPQAVARLQLELKRRMEVAGEKAYSVQVPINSTVWKAGKIVSRDAYYPNLMRPIFVVGADETSLAWLKKWRAQLKEKKAIGWIVQAKNEQELRAIDAAGAGLMFMAVGGEKISKLFNLNSYPVLISSRSIEQ